MADHSTEDAWAPLAEQFVDRHYSSLRGKVRTHVIHQHLLRHLGLAPQRVVDIGGGAGNQSLPLARLGYEVTIVDPSPAILERASQTLSGEDESTASRVRLVESAGESAPERLDGERFDAVLCHGVLMYLDDPEPLVDSLCRLTDDGGLLSIVAKNVEVMATRHIHDGDWKAAIAAFDSPTQVNGLGVRTRGDSVANLSGLIVSRSVEPIDWYGVRLFTDGWIAEDSNPGPEDLVFEAELLASQRDPYRRMSRLFHLVGRKQDGQSPDG